MQARIRLLANKYRAALAQLKKPRAKRASLELLLGNSASSGLGFLRRMPGSPSYDTSLLTLERLYFRHVPLTGWMQEEIPRERGRGVTRTDGPDSGCGGAKSLALA